jgi:tetratricopeptide (TPR) repeat protein
MDAFSNVILIHLSRKEYDQAIEKCDAQLEKVGSNPLAQAMIHNFKGRIHTIQNDLDAAEAAFKGSIEASPNFAPSYYALAGLYLRKGEADEAIAQYEDILAKSPNQARPHMMLGIIYDSRKERDKAEEHYRKALEIEPDFAPAANNLAYLLADQDKDLELALGYAQTAKGKLPNDPSVMDTLGWVYYKKGFYDLAIAEFLDSIEKNPEIAAVHYHLGLAYHQNGEMDKAKEALEKALSLDDDFDGADKAKEILSEL